MSSSSPSSAHESNVVAAVDRIQPATFSLTLWGDRFLSIDTDHEGDDLVPELLQGTEEYEVLKEEVRRRLVMTTEITGTGTGTGDADDDGVAVAITQKLRLIDAVQRLGIGYHFETEIEEALQELYVLGGESFIEKRDSSTLDLYHASLWFRLLRQQGFRVSPDGFRRFMDKEGKFKESLVSNEEGLLSLYEAAHVALHGEDILDEALRFATQKLESIVQNHESTVINQLVPITPSTFQHQAEFSLSLPAWKCIPRTLARHSIDVVYAHDQTAILKFAKLDFNMVQKLHQLELHQLSVWWASLEVKTKFPYAKDRLVECYYWINGAYFEPKYHLSRVMVSKFACLLSLLDDVFDNFGKYDELQILTEAIQRMDIDDLEALPDTMKNIYRIIVNLYEETERDFSEIGPIYGVDYSKRQFKKMCQSFLAEVGWRTKAHVPTLEEYMMDAKLTSSYRFVFPTAWIGMGAEIATIEAFEWVTNTDNKMATAASVICRLQNDIMSHQFERKRKHAASAVECYAKEHDVSAEDAKTVLWEKISSAWKDIAEECQKPRLFPVALTDRILNFARVISVMYGKGDGLTHPRFLKEHIATLFVNPVPI